MDVQLLEEVKDLWIQCCISDLAGFNNHIVFVCGWYGNNLLHYKQQQILVFHHKRDFPFGLNKIIKPTKIYEMLYQQQLYTSCYYIEVIAIGGVNWGERFFAKMSPL